MSPALEVKVQHTQNCRPVQDIPSLKQHLEEVTMSMIETAFIRIDGRMVPSSFDLQHERPSQDRKLGVVVEPVGEASTQNGGHFHVLAHLDVAVRVALYRLDLLVEASEFPLESGGSGFVDAYN
jgi:hypothetical protein